MGIGMIKKVIFGLMVVFFISGCSANRERGIAVVKGPFYRVVSTAPSNTEIIVDLGLAHKLVAIDRHSANIDGLPDGLLLLDFFFPDAEAIINIEPDIIIASGHNPTGSGVDPFRLLSEMGIPVVYISMSRSIEDIYEDIALIAGLLQAEEEGEELIKLMKTQISHFAMQNAAAPVTVYFEISAAPEIMTFGKNSFINDMISVIGARNIFESEEWLVMPSAEVIIERNPDVIFTNVDYIDDPIGEIKSRPGFNHISAVANNRVYQIDNDSSVRSSARIVLALQQMAQVIHPELSQ
jgi:iron complex transport system substrate-binding protein